MRTGGGGGGEREYVCDHICISISPLSAVLQMFLTSAKPTVRFAAVKTLNKVCPLHPLEWFSFHHSHTVQFSFPNVPFPDLHDPPRGGDVVQCGPGEPHLRHQPQHCHPGHHHTAQSRPTDCDTDFRILYSCDTQCQSRCRVFLELWHLFSEDVESHFPPPSRRAARRA